MKTPELGAAYRATAYCVALPTGSVCLRLGEASPALVAALVASGAREWAIVCAANPASRQLSDAENALRFAELNARIADLGYPGWLGVNLADDDGWPPEASLLVPGLVRATALSLAADFGQNAIVAGGADGVPELVWVG